MFAKVAKHFGASGNHLPYGGNAANSVIFISKCFISTGQNLFASRGSEQCKYEKLGLTPEATDKEIKAAYYQKSREFHPDLNKSEDAAREFQAINDAYETLSNDVLRHDYDVSRRYGRPTSGFNGGFERDYNDMNIPPESSREFSRRMKSRMRKADFTVKDDVWEDSPYGGGGPKSRGAWMKLKSDMEFLNHLTPEMRKTYEQQIRDMTNQESGKEDDRPQYRQGSNQHYYVPLFIVVPMILLCWIEMYDKTDTPSTKQSLVPNQPFTRDITK